MRWYGWFTDRICDGEHVAAKRASAAVQTARKHAAPDSSAPQNPMMDKWRNFKEGIIDHFARGIIRKSETTFGNVKADVRRSRIPAVLNIHRNLKATHRILIGDRTPSSQMGGPCGGKISSWSVGVIDDPRGRVG